MMWVASPHFVNDQPDELDAYERGFILENPHPAIAARHPRTFSC